MRIRKFSSSFWGNTNKMSNTAAIVAEEQGASAFSAVGHSEGGSGSGLSGSGSGSGRGRINSKKFLLAGVALLVLLLVVAGVVLAIVNASMEGEYTGKIEPGVSISSVYVGKQTRDSAKANLEKQLAGYTQKPLVLTFQDKTWTPTLDQLGVGLNLDASLDQAAAFNQGGGFITGSRLYKLANPQVTNIPLQVQLDETKLQAYLNKVSDSIHQDAVDPTLKVKDGLAIVTSGKVGYSVDVSATLAGVKASLVGLVPTTQNLLHVTTVNPTISEADLNLTRDKINALTGKPLEIHFNDKVWTLDQKTLGGLITLQHNTDATQGSAFNFTVNQDYIKNFVTDLGKGINQDAQDGKLGWDNGHVIATTPSKDGQQLDVDKSVAAVMASLNDPTNRSANLVVTVTKPSLDTNNLDALGIHDLIGEGVSHFGGSEAARGHNIIVGASYLTGTFIKPHTTFSFLDTIGDISAKRGYWKGYAIVAEQTVPDVGGGICQVSTTTFRAAFFAGLPIAERHEHAYRVHWYEEMGEPVGFDAAVYEPGSDFKFENPYDTWIYLQAYTENGYLHVKLYGTKVDGQTVELKASGPYNWSPAKPDKFVVDPSLPMGAKTQVDYAQRGLDADITRIIKVNGTVVKNSKFTSHFEAWSNIYKVGPTPAPPPPPKPVVTAQPTPTTGTGTQPPAKPTGTATPAPPAPQATPAPTTPAKG
jgi:vancomycin resistance protein YoaR